MSLSKCDSWIREFYLFNATMRLLMIRLPGFPPHSIIRFRSIGNANSEDHLLVPGPNYLQSDLN